MSCLTLCQCFQFLSQFLPGCCSVFLEGADWTDFSAQAGDSALPGYLHFHCVLELSNKDYLFHSQLDLEFLFRDRYSCSYWACPFIYFQSRQYNMKTYENGFKKHIAP